MISEVVGPAPFYCGDWAPGKPDGVEMIEGRFPGQRSKVTLRLDPLKPIDQIEYYASGADARQMP